MNPKILKICIAIATTSFVMISCGEAAKPQDDPNNQAALAEIKKEPEIKEAIITDANVLYVTVDDDGTKRDGYAQYLCEVLKEKKATTNWVKVMKVNSINDPNADNAFGVLLGEAHCGN